MKRKRQTKVRLNSRNIDQYGNLWTPFNVDYLALQEDGTCSICGETIDSGWLCLDGGDEVCHSHVIILDR